jgi:transcriptional regulator with GAF, ATPase, and Fis domain
MKMRIVVVGANAAGAKAASKAKRINPQADVTLIDRGSFISYGACGIPYFVSDNAIHYGSTRSNGPFIKVNCGAIPESLIDSELFGHEKGAFTGALIEKRGRFERADGGTLFLDEIGELPLQAQVRLLRVLQSRELERVGGTKPIPIDIRIIAATHRNLEQMIIEKHFREDLWFRINVFPIFLPPLRQRRDDIPALTRYLVQTKSKELGLSAAPSIAPGALARLMKYDWPGNIRELQNIVERELIRYRGGDLNFESLASDTILKEIKPSPAQEQGNLKPVKLAEAMALHIGKIIEHTNGRVNGPGGAAELLGINPSTLRSRMRKLGVSRSDY